jgi:hypothetical protein
MKAIHLLRKPCSESTVAGNVLKFGCGAINVDATRIQMTLKDREVITSMGGFGSEGWANTTSPTYNTNNPKNPMVRTPAIAHSQGRWPANVVFQHREGCHPVGTTTVRGDSRISDYSPRQSGMFNVGQVKSDGRPRGTLHGDQSVLVYDCAPTCPVAALNTQSGILAPQGGQKRLDTGGTSFLGTGHDGAMDSTFYGDTGGASRFFKQFVGKPE